MVNELYLQKVIKLLRDQLEWKIPSDENFYKHVVKILEHNDVSDMSPEEFVVNYRLQFKPGYPDHPTGGALVDGHYGEEGDMFILVNPAPEER